MIVPCWTSPEGEPFATGGPARVWTHRMSEVARSGISLSASARFFQEHGVAGQPLAHCSTPCTSCGLRFETLGDPSWLQVDLVDSVIADAGWDTSYPGSPDLESDPPTFTPFDAHRYIRARVGLFGTFVETWFKIRAFDRSNTVFQSAYDVTLQASASGYVEVEKWEQALFYDQQENPVALTCLSNDDIGNGPTGQRAERWNRVTFIHVDIEFTGADIAPGFPATGTLEFGTPGGSGEDTSVTAYPYPELTLTTRSVAYASAQAFGDTVAGHEAPCVGTATATGASCPYSGTAGNITRDANTGTVTITNSDNPGLNNLGTLLMNQDGPVGLSYTGSVKRLDQPMSPVPVEFFIPGLSNVPEGAVHVGDMAGGLSFSGNWPRYVVREGRVGIDPSSAILAQSAGAPDPKAQIWLYQAWLHNPNYRSLPPNPDFAGIDVVNDVADYRIMATGETWSAMTLEHKQSLAIPGSWTGGGDAVLTAGKWSSASGTGYVYRDVSSLDAEDYGKLKLPLTADGSVAALTLWINKQTFDTATGHEGKSYPLITHAAGVEYDNLVNLCMPLNPLANTDEDSMTPPFTRIPNPGRDLQQSRWPAGVYKFAPFNGTIPNDTDGPYWGIGGGITQLRIEGLAAGESYTVGEPALVVDKTDTIDMVAGNGQQSFGVSGFTGLADGKQSGDWPHMIIGADATAELWNGVALDTAGIDSSLGASRHGLHVCTITDLCNIINTSPAWVAAPTATGHALNNADRPAACLNGMGGLGGWNTDLTAGAITVRACQMWDSIFDQSGSVDFEFCKVIGASVAGVITDGAGGPNAMSGVDEYAETDPAGVLDTWTLFGTGSTDAEGKFETAAPALVLRNSGGPTVVPTVICQDLEPAGIGSFAGSFLDPAIAVNNFEYIVDVFGNRDRSYWIHRRRWRAAFRDPVPVTRHAGLCIIERRERGIGYRYNSDGLNIRETVYRTSQPQAVGSSEEHALGVVTQGARPAAERDVTDTRHLWYSLAGQLWYRTNSGGGWGAAAMALAGYSPMATCYVEMDHRVLMLALSGGRAKMLRWDRAALPDPTLSVNGALIVDLGAADDARGGIEWILNGTLQAWWLAGGETVTAVSNDYGRTWNAPT